MNSSLQRERAPRSACGERPAGARLAWLLALAASLFACTGGPGTQPPLRAASSDSVNVPTTPTVGEAAAAGSRASMPQGPASAPVGATVAGSGAAGTGAAGTTAAVAAGSGAAPAPSGSAGFGAVPPPGSPGAGAAGGGTEVPVSDGGVCPGPTGVLSPDEGAPSNLLLILDRSADMAGDFQGTPRWQLASHSVQATLRPRAADLTLGAVLYPSDSPATACVGPAWLCGSADARCAVSSMASSDQLAFQPAGAALDALSDTKGLYAPMSDPGAPLAESILRADAALATQALTGKTTVVILASSVPSCAWDAAGTSELLARWQRERGVVTHVIALPGSPAGTAPALAALAEAGASGRVHSPTSAGALDATLQAVAYGSTSSCTLELDPPAPSPESVRLLVTEAGVERSIPRVAADGEAQWTIDPSGRTLTLLGSLCVAATSGSYDGLRIQLSCDPSPAP